MESGRWTLTALESNRTGFTSPPLRFLALSLRFLNFYLSNKDSRSNQLTVLLWELWEATCGVLWHYAWHTPGATVLQMENLRWK